MCTLVYTGMHVSCNTGHIKLIEKADLGRIYIKKNICVQLFGSLCLAKIGEKVLSKSVRHWLNNTQFNQQAAKSLFDLILE